MAVISRDTKIDFLKFLLIFLVVLGHLSYYDYGICANRLIYSFHMPLFVFLSGYLTSSSFNKEKHLKWIGRTLLIYIIAQTGHLIINLTKGASISPLFYIYPQLALWYLICLIYWRISIWTVFRKINSKNLIITSLVLCFLSGFVPLSEECSFQRAFAFFPFFVTGFIFKKNHYLDRLEKVPILYVVIAIVACLIITRLTPRIYMPKYHYEDYKEFALRIIQTIIGFILCLSVFRLSRSFHLEKIAKFGMYTLWIYIGHTFLIRLNIHKLIESSLGIRLDIFTAIVLSAFYCCIFIILHKLYSNIKEYFKKTDEI